ncbi:receptor protein kinase TMK1-like [Tripterygium wilfordii]|uniref:receptor protein kinase TMK1-like n=1 Tax=Tripterygium wilfordii TaxID=458696 RepID=UPI0018F826E7|nr:receptor protein kinase TMK1-like [Tripterygium wilfordii]
MSFNAFNCKTPEEEETPDQGRAEDRLCTYMFSCPVEVNVWLNELSVCNLMGKITTKADVYSYGVVLMELFTGLTALDERRSEESQKLKAAIDPQLDTTEETLESISIIAELAGHCTAREPNHRPDMCHAVNVLSPLVEEWKPTIDESDNSFGNDSSPPLLQMLKAWKESESSTVSYNSLSDNSKGSIPERPAGLADSFNSADAR